MTCLKIRSSLSPTRLLRVMMNWYGYLSSSKLHSERESIQTSLSVKKKVYSAPRFNWWVGRELADKTRHYELVTYYILTCLTCKRWDCPGLPEDCAPPVDFACYLSYFLFLTYFWVCPSSTRKKTPQKIKEDGNTIPEKSQDTRPELKIAPGLSNSMRGIPYRLMKPRKGGRGQKGFMYPAVLFLSLHQSKRSPYRKKTTSIFPLSALSAQRMWGLGR